MERVGREKGILKDVRGYGTHLGFDLHSEEMADSVQRWLFRSGIQVLKCGPATIGLRPSLVLGPQECAVLRDALLHYHPNFEK